MFKDPWKQGNIISNEPCKILVRSVKNPQRLLKIVTRSVKKLQRSWKTFTSRSVKNLERSIKIFAIHIMDPFKGHL